MAKTHGLSVKPLKVKRLAGEQKATEFLQAQGAQPDFLMFASEFQPFQLAGPGSAAWACGSMRQQADRNLADSTALKQSQLPSGALFPLILFEKG